ncbi:MAG TPA: pitrilysin family protein, partial [Thermoanaerobaculia bacterium]|nr:pitrilysin family protein [Thermoanaerobaculia bacterium]
MSRFRPFAATLLLAALATAPAPAVAAEIPAHPRDLAFSPLAFEVPDPAAYRHELPGGIVAFVAEDRALPLVKIALTLRTGAFLEGQGEEGLASLTAAMLRRGGAGELSAEAFDERLDFLATNLNVAAGATSTTVSLDCLSHRLDESLDLLFAMLTAPRFEAERFEVEKGSLRERLAQRNDDAAEILEREWGWLLYGPGHVAARQMTAAGLSALDRDALVRFHSDTYRPEQLVVAVAGDVDTEAILGGLARRLAAWKATGPAIPWPPVTPEPRGVPGLYRVEKEIPQGK